MMSYLIFCFALLISTGGVFLEKRFVHQGEKVLLFRNVEIDPDKNVSLYMNVNMNHIHIVTWTIKNNVITPQWMGEKYKKINMDENRDIWITSVDENFIGVYLIQNSSRPEVEIIIFDKKLVYRGDKNVLLFANVDNPTKDVSLYIFREKNYTLNLTLQLETERDKTERMTVNFMKIYMDQNRDIRIDNVDENYTGKYFIQNSSRPGVELIILVKKSVHRGENVHLFENTSDSGKEVSLYINGEKNYTLIFIWMIEKDNNTAEWMAHNYTKIHLEQNGDIWIDNIDENYTGKYFILNSPRPGVDLIILGSRENLESDSEKTIYIVTTVGLILVIIAGLIICIPEYKKCRRSQRRENDIPQRERLMHPSSPSNAEAQAVPFRFVTINLHDPRSRYRIEAKEKGKNLRKGKQPNVTTDLPKTPLSSSDTRKTKDKTYMEDLRSSKTDIRMGSGRKAKSALRDTTLHHRKHLVSAK